MALRRVTLSAAARGAAAWGLSVAPLAVWEAGGMGRTEIHQYVYVSVAPTY